MKRSLCSRENTSFSKAEIDKQRNRDKPARYVLKGGHRHEEQVKVKLFKKERRPLDLLIYFRKPKLG